MCKRICTFQKGTLCDLIFRIALMSLVQRNLFFPADCSLYANSLQSEPSLVNGGRPSPCYSILTCSPALTVLVWSVPDYSNNSECATMFRDSDLCGTIQEELSVPPAPLVSLTKPLDLRSEHILMIRSH